MTALDHLVLTVRDIDRTCDWYVRALGLSIVSFGEGRTALSFGDQKINLHLFGREFEPKASLPTPGSADLCFLTDVPLAEVADHWRSIGVAIEQGPVARTGATGPLLSLYARDPDGNLIEIANPVSRRE
ncbi:MAG: VOC family protein [Capsulimonadales bacterium]|nr:VOC family protein [Capsulimonadales bacterium]